ncbi:LOW QUALITY PROTEIN: small EDRK-rich factor 2 [Alca torda]
MEEKLRGRRGPDRTRGSSATRPRAPHRPSARPHAATPPARHEGACPLPSTRPPARGNQRELARQKNLKKQSDWQGQRRDDGLSAAARKQSDSEIMQQKQKKADEKKEGAK